ncbi:Inner membrane transport protein YbaT [Edwardsiella anguillarum]|uniref:APC family permease n=1 Tax=Edwardsiella anguillarum TaxID=1821960 RepID=UPI00045CFB79|nr:APC family permease [Edwardsiella anguillarum]GAJ68234.1 inner membrane transport protein YbaT [Edwardsiella piscicida]RFT04597.1 amino acid permease [Edwardsiella anguillarum]BET81864.1 Inner membrane transport protein YbaT [Edwardsiella anguillarum]BET85293.1 Inner membrane transport protein YbaT [Edwardsiella anguillarum]BET88656.1 Inner membrane transport protein YbaT [Edwardsiella anguillarum]
MNAGDGDNEKPLGLWHVVAIGIGAMVGAGIFALLGQAALLMRSSTWLAFVFGGVVAMFSGYAYARLGARYPSNGGIIDFFRRGLGDGLLTLSLSLLYLVTLVLTIAMVARAFGAYAADLLHDGSQDQRVILSYALGVIALMALFNALSSHAVGRLEVVLVAVKLGILLVLIAAGVWALHPASLTLTSSPGGGAFFSAIGITFLAYAGFGMMANAADKVRSPATTMPRAFTLAIGVTALLYVTLALVLVSDVPAAQLERYADTAVAQAAYPLLGRVGYTIVAIGALLATASAINATLFAAFNIMASMGSEGELPEAFHRPLWRQSTPGNLTVMALIMLITLLLDLGALANVASATFLFCYLAVFVVAWRLRREIGAAAPLLLCGALVMLLVIVGFIFSLWQQGGPALLWVLGALLLSLALALFFRRGRTVWKRG